MKPLPLQASPIKAAKNEIAALLGALPARRACRLSHLGLLGGGQRNYPSQEGPLLSASTCPDAWREIAKLGGLPLWEIARSDGKALKLLSRTAKQGWRKLETWGLETGLLSKETWWWTPCSTTEEGEPLYCWSRSPGEDLNPETDEKAEEHEVPVACRALLDFWHQREPSGNRPKSPWTAMDALAAALIEAAHRMLDPLDPALPDGLFWGEALEPQSLSAPRAGIFPHPKISATAEAGGAA